MTETRIKVSSIIDNQLPEFVIEEFPLVSEFLSQYYISLENKGNISDILNNIDQYIKVDNLTNLIESTNLLSDVTFFDSTINVESTAGFPNSYGILLIDSEIITYTSKTSTSFEGCIRGFSGITSYGSKDELIFTETQSEEHVSGTVVANLSILFLKQFLNKVKKQITPGFEDRELFEDLNENLFIKQSIDFYSSKGTDSSFKILFGALYGQSVEVIKPRDYLIQPSSAKYRITADLVVEAIEGNPEQLVNQTLYQDDQSIIGAAQGTITKVEKIRRSSKDYYQISLDFDYDKDIQTTGTIFGEFSIHPKTKLVSPASIGTNTLEVDSTVGFPNSGDNIIVELDNGTSLTISYTSKTLNQFLGCSGISQDIPISTEIKTNFFAYGYSGNEIVKIRILGVLHELKIPEDTKFYKKGDKIRIKTLGIDLKDYKANNWFYNITSKYKVEYIELADDSDRSYRIKLYDNHIIKIGDSVTLIPSAGTQINGIVVSFINEKFFTVQFGSNVQLLDINLSYTIQRNLSKVDSIYPNANQYTANVQNVYNDEESLYVAASSLPSYGQNSLSATDRSIEFSGSFSPDDLDDLTVGTTIDIGKNHKFYTGDAIVYKPTDSNSLGISTGIYFVKKIDDTRIKLSRSKSNIFTANFIAIDTNGSIVNSKFEILDHTYDDLTTRILDSQKLIRKISDPIIDDKVYETIPGSTGIFVNGTELLNYKSNDNVYYGPIEKIIPTSPGSGYDIIDPPTLTVTDPIGFGATAYCSVIGGLERIDILDPGFDYIEDPFIEISGGNGSEASARANLISFDYSIRFNSSSVSVIKINPINEITLSEPHKFRDIEEVIYDTKNQPSVVGLTTNSSYFVSSQNEYTIKLYKSFEDAVSGINTIQLTAVGSGIHIFRSKNKKKKIGSITIENSGYNYQTKLTTTSSVGIVTSLDIIRISDHGYENGEIIVYNATQTPIGGLSSSTSYYVTKVNDNEFKLSEIGISTAGISTSFYYDTKQYINLTSVGSGIHKFNYPSIKVEVKGKVGVSTLVASNQASVQPVFTGKIQSVHVSSGGVGYGASEILNYNRQPLFDLNSGSGIQLTPTVSDGKIVNVLIRSSGSGYDSAPNLIVNGDGIGAVLTPIMSNGTLIGVKIISGGIGYNSNNTTISIVSKGSGAKFEAQIKLWRVNLVERLLLNSQINDDDGILVKGTNPEYGLQYGHAYVPRNLRLLVQGSKIENGSKIYIQDLQVENGNEIPTLTSKGHSPIIGWAYDGNPIYGPYGYSSDQEIKLMTSSYELLGISNNPNRPSTSIYPNGFFIEDYIFTGKGDLDEHNGKFGATPEYPNGIYAYFSTITFASDLRKKNVFPYIIGDSYKSRPIEFNFIPNSNQDYIDINDTGWSRNITPYNISTYDYLFDRSKINIQNSIIRNVSKGFIDSIGIVTGGKNYKIDDRLIFDYKSKEISGAKVSLLKGKDVSSINYQSTEIDNVLFYPYQDTFIGFATTPHNLSPGDLVTFTGKYDYKKSGNISINTNSLLLTVGVGSAQYTGIITYFKVSGNLNYPNIRENDFYQIGNEQVKILNIDSQSSRIRVIRNQNATVGVTSYPAGTILVEKPRKFKLNFGVSTSYNFNLDREIYFNPVESVGLGTTSGVGIFTTIYFSNPGSGITQISIPTQTIYIEGHNLNTGDSLTYSSNGGTGISVSNDGISSFELSNNSIVYAAKVSNNLIGISTIKVGLNSLSNFVGIGSTSSGILYFTSIGSGINHSFKTNYTDILEGEISKNVVTVSTAETHGLSLLDNVIVKIKSGISTTFVVKYDDYNRRVVINPRSFSSIDISNNIIEINNHGYYNGQKVIYTANTPANGLINEGIYYVVVVDSDRIKLSNDYYSTIKENPDVIDITTSEAGVISSINPPLNLINGQIVTFDLSDSSLSFLNNSTQYPAFDFTLYEDQNFKKEFKTTKTSPIFEVTKQGKVGIDSTAKVTLKINNDVPNILYYSLVPTNLNLNSTIKKQIIIDKDVLGYSKLSINGSKYDGNYKVTSLSPTTFSYNILEEPESTSYSNNVDYYTNSSSAYGSIEKVFVPSYKRKYSELPNITSIISDYGSGSVLLSNSNSIGKVLSTEIEDIGFDYSSDYSVRPLAKFPDILELDSLSTFDYIGITSFGKNYNTIPDLIAIDGVTNRPISGINLRYSFGDSAVTIVKNSKEINNATPKIIAINNSNGIKISNVQFNNVTKDVTVTLGASFSNSEDYPFEVGGKVLIEGINVGINTDGKGYNSADYEYSLFTLTAIDPNLGGAVGVVTYNLSSYLKPGEFPGNYNNFYSSGRIIPESYLPVFNPVLKKNGFYNGEVVYTSSAEGTVESWDPNRQYLKVSTIDDFLPNQILRGKTSDSAALIKNTTSFSSNYTIKAYSPRRKGWNTEIGFLNNDFQRVHDSDYYQYFSYDIRSKTDLSTWDNAVSTLNHTAGFKKFANLIIESSPSNLGISTDQNQGDFTGTADFTSFINLNCVNDFDLAKENNLFFSDGIKSDEIIFNSKIIQDYIESIGNRVLMIDDISSLFNSNPRPTQFSEIDSFLLSDIRSSKYLIYIRDRRFAYENQLSLVSLIHNNENGFINQYGTYSTKNLGFFDFSISGTRGNLLFYPTKSKVNDYNLAVFSFSLSDVSSGIGTINLGDSAIINTNTVTIPQGTDSSYTIVGIASTYRSSKILVQIGATDNSYFEHEELTILHDGEDVYFSEYGQIATDSFSSQSTTGIGVYNAYISGSEIKIDLIPNVPTEIDFVVNTFNISIANTNSTGIGTELIGGTLLKTSSTLISASPSPTSNIISDYSNDFYNSSYSIIVIEDLTNLDYQVSEFLTITNNIDCYSTEFGNVYSNSPLGITTVGVSGNVTNLYFTPLEDIEVSIKVFQVNLGLKDEFKEVNLI